MDKTENPWISVIAKWCVGLTLFLIFLGAIVTTAGAGMAAPNAPHVDGTMLNPNIPGTGLPWWKDPFLLKEHSHRLAAMGVGLGVGALCALLWRNFTAFFVAVAFMGAASGLTRAGLEPSVVAQLRVWPAMLIFVGMLIFTARKRGEKPDVNQWLVLAAYVATCIQAAVGTLRVEIETAGHIALATSIRTAHGIFAQVFLALLVVIAARLSPVWRELERGPKLDCARKLHVMGIIGMWLYIFQLGFGAYLRHRGLGMAIQTWPMAAGGGLLPEQWTHAIGIHFLHSRVMPVLLAGHLISLGVSCMVRAKTEPRLRGPGQLLVVLIVLQIVLGAMVIWKVRHAHITNTHVMFGAFICATLALITARAHRLQTSARPAVG